jgi:signal peptidase I
VTQPGDEVVPRLPLPGEVASDPDAAGDAAVPADRGGVRRLVIEIVETLVLTAVIFFVIQTFVAQPFEVKQISMERTLEPGHYVLVDKLTPRFDPYHLGDIVVFAPPDSEADVGTPFIKRVIGRAGDLVEILDTGQVSVNGTVLDEPYLYRSDPDGPTDPTEASGVSSWTVGEGELFVMGDHRGDSVDSRVFGMVPVDNVVGRAWLRYWPLDVFGLLGGATGADGADASSD